MKPNVSNLPINQPKVLKIQRPLKPLLLLKMKMLVKKELIPMIYKWLWNTPNAARSMLLKPSELPTFQPSMPFLRSTLEISDGLSPISKN
jgi:hypothetical protein